MIFTENGIILFLQEKYIDLFSLFMRNYLAYREYSVLLYLWVLGSTSLPFFLSFGSL